MECLPDSPTAVHEDILTGDKAAGITDEKHRHTLQFFGQAHAPQRRPGLKAFDELGHGVFHPLRRKWPRTDGVHPHAVTSPVCSQMTRQMDNASFDAMIKRRTVDTQSGIGVGVAGDDPYMLAILMIEPGARRSRK